MGTDWSDNKMGLVTLDQKYGKSTFLKFQKGGTKNGEKLIQSGQGGVQQKIPVGGRKVVVTEKGCGVGWIRKKRTLVTSPTEERESHLLASWGGRG